MYVQILTFIISIIAFITIVFIMILFSPKYWFLSLIINMGLFRL
jgi:hypothetical protein